ncbi:flagellar basal body-associated FliL family protein [Budvicia aquatica]|uniref:flagellar basal body-associated FliL family protein n=1 Tax=Budvicia aquatica TaxID=82979 RepID=UPI00141A7A1E|nr:flagellar basal body-associated FliL family protein [Budvicia aquatica]
MLLDLALTASNEELANKVESAIPLIQSSTVNLLTNMNYSDIRSMSVVELRQKLLDEYKKAYEELKMTVTFNDVLISKMVFQ